MGALRARNGHPGAVSRVRFWQVGNERRGQDYERTPGGVLPGHESSRPDDRADVIVSDARRSRTRQAPGSILSRPTTMNALTQAAEEADMNASTPQMIADHAKRPADHRRASPSGTRPQATAAPGRGQLWSLANALACSRYQQPDAPAL